jgi:peptide/nickel transport system substrate-binding protein
MKASRFLLTPFLVLVSVLILVGCAPATPASAPAATTLPPTQAPPTPVPPTAAPTAAKANVAVYAHTTTLPDIDPSVSFSNDSVVTSNAYETLVWYNPPGSKELLQPGLAVKWESNTDGTEWTFFLRQGVKFHDGTDFNAEAVKYSIERTMELGLGASYIWDPVDTITVVDNYTVKFSLKYPAPLDLIGPRQRLVQRRPRCRNRALPDRELRARSASDHDPLRRLLGWLEGGPV